MGNFDLKKYLAEGKLSEGVWKIGNPDDIRDFIKKLAELKRDYWDVVGSDTVIDGIDSAMDEAKILLDIKMGRVQSEEFDIEEGENNIDETYSEDAPEWWKDLWKELDESKAKKCKCGKGETCKCNNIKEDSFGGAGTDKRSGQVIGDIIQLIRSTGIDPSDVMEEVGQEFGVAFEFGRG